jgi:thiol-disulfide isomerase/thioredoxin
MKLNIKRIALFTVGVLCVGAACMSNSVYAESQQITSAGRFRRLLNKKELVAALFYETEDPKNGDFVHGLKGTFNSLSKRYTDDVTFAMINCSKAALEDLAPEYGVTKMPALVLFDDGHVVRAHGGKPAMLIGYSDRKSMQNFMDSYVGDRIKERLHEAKRDQQDREQKKERRVVKRTTRVYNAAPYWNTYPYYGGGYGPYYGGYYGRPYFGFGIGFGSRWW